MAHELLIRHGEASMMYVGEVPWHGLGTKLDRPATSREALHAAGLGWEVEKRPLCYREGPLTFSLPGKYVVVPGAGWGSGIRPAFGVVGKSFVPLQNREAFSFFDPIVGKNAAVYHTAGALDQGARIWILAKLPDSIRVAGDDITDKYLLLCNSHDGHGSVHVKFTPIRVVCNNTLTMAIRRGPALKIAHTRDMRRQLREADRLLGIIHRRYGALANAFQAMARMPMSGLRLDEYLAAVFPEPDDPEDVAARRNMTRDRTLAAYFFEQGAGNRMPGVRGTLWAAYNGVTEYVDHRAMKTCDAGRLNAIWYGEGYRVKARAFEKAAHWLTGQSV